MTIFLIVWLAVMTALAWVIYRNVQALAEAVQTLAGSVVNLCDLLGAEPDPDDGEEHPASGKVSPIRRVA